MDLKGLQLTSRFSLPPNALGYCGRDSAPERFKKCVIDGVCTGVERELTQFIVLHPYMQLLAKITGHSKYSYKIFDAYWIGNKELLKAKDTDYFLLLKYFKKQGVPQWLLDELHKTPPKKFIPSHLFQILHVGVGRASGSVPYNINSINNCMIRWGKVRKLVNNEAEVELNSVERTSKKFKLVKKVEKHPIVPNFIKNLKKGDIVTVHWGLITKKLTKDETDKITYWTKFVIDSF